jgi:uncharacterized delta-60 repeat protein
MRLNKILLTTVFALGIVGGESAQAAVCNWLGGNANGWADNGNWSCAGGPSNGDSLVFLDGSGNKTHTHNRSTLTSVVSITFSGCGYTITGGLGLTVTASAAITSDCTLNGQTNGINLPNVQLTGVTPINISNNVAGAVGTILNIGSAANPLRWSGELRFTNGNSSANTVNVVLSEIAAGSAVTKLGGGFVTFPAANTYSGLTTIEGGTILTQNAAALGSGGTAANATLVRSGGVLDIQNSYTNEFLTLEDNVNNGTRSAPNLQVRANNVTWGGPITLAGVPNGSQPPRSELRTIGANITWSVAGVISGASEIRHFGNATSKLFFTAANTYSGETVISSGTLSIGGAAERLPDTTVVQLLSGARLDFFATANGVTETIAGLTGAGDVTLDANSQANPRLVLNTPLGKVFDLSGGIGGAGTIPITVRGDGTQIFSGTNTYSSATDVRENVIVDVRGSLASQVTMQNNSRLRSDALGAVVGVQFAGSTDTPHLQPGGVGTYGILQVGNGSNAFIGTGAVEFDIAGNSPGVDQDQLSYVGGGVNLANTQLQINFAAHLASGNSATLVTQSVGNVTGTFGGFPNNSYYPSGPAPIKYQLKYNDAGGNVKITRLSPISYSAGAINGRVGQSLSTPALSPTGGVLPYASMSISGAPAWLSGAQSGNTLILSGTVAAPIGAQNFTLNVVDSAGQTGTFPLSISVGAPGPGDIESLSANIVGFQVLATVAQPDGKLIIAGQFTSVLGQPRNNIARINANGTLDASFNPNADSSVTSLALQADGKILLGGFFTNVGGGARNRIARVAADGTLDIGFNPNANAQIYCIAVQTNGQILLGGAFTNLGASTRNGIARVAVNGILDAGFDPNANSRVVSMAVQADGQILLGGLFNSVGGTTRNRIARVAANGSLDTGFDPNADAQVTSIAVQADGQILLGGNFNNLSGTNRNHIARLAVNGSLDAGFNPNLDNVVHSIAVQADGKILLGGQFANVTGTSRNFIARVTATGTLDPSFDPNTDNTVFSLALQPDGQVQLAGQFSTVGGSSRNLFARLLNDPATQVLTAPDASQVLWSRGGSAPELSQTTFELSIDGGVSYTPLGGTATRVGNTANWQLSGLSLPATGLLRASGRSTAGYSNGSSGIVQQVASFVLSTDFSWNGSVDSNWLTAGNWTPAGPPASNSIVRFPESAVSKIVTGVPARPFDFFEIGGGYSISGVAGVVLSNATPLRFSTTGSSSALLVPLTLTNSNAVVTANIEFNGAPDFEIGNLTGDLNFSGNLRFELSNVPFGSGGRVRLKPHLQAAAQSGNVSYIGLGSAIGHEVLLSNNSNYTGLTTITGPNLRVRSVDLTAPFGLAAGITDTQLTDAVIELENTSPLSSNSYAIDRERVIAFSNGISHIATLSSFHTTAGSTVQWLGPMQYSGSSGAEFFDITANNNGIFRINSPITGTGTLRFGENIIGVGTVAMDGPASFVGDIEIKSGQELLTLNPEIIPNTTKVSIFGTGRFDLNGNQETIAALEGISTSSVVDVTGSVSLLGRLTTMSGNSAFAGQIISALPNGGFYQITGGTQTLSGNNTFIEPADIAGGTLILEGNLPNAKINGGTLRIAGGSPSNMTTLASASPSATGTLDLRKLLQISGSVNLNSPISVIAWVDADQSGVIRLNGNVNITGTSLTLVPSGTPIGLGGSYDLIDISIVGGGALTGIFSGKPDNTVFSNGGLFFRINYTSKKATITRVNPPPVVVMVTTTSDPGNSSNCSLRKAVEAVASGSTPLNSNCAAGAPGATIIFDPAVFSSTQTIALSGGAIVINTSLSIDGPGARLLIIGAVTSSAIFSIDDGVPLSFSSVSMSGMTLTSGLALSPKAFGGAIASNEDLLVAGMRFSGNTARYTDPGPGQAKGGAIYMGLDADLTVLDSLFFGNSATSAIANSDALGGAIYLDKGILDISNSTFTANSAIVTGAAGANGPNALGGAIYANAGDSNIETTTIANNITRAQLSALAGAGPESSGAGVYAVLSALDSMVLRSSVLAGNLSQSTGTARTAFADINATGAMGVSFCSISSALPATVTAANAVVGAALLKPLANNGGAIDTIAFSNASALRDAGDPGAISLPQYDQRGPGFPRVAGANFDVGAFEQQLLLTPLNGVLPAGTAGVSYSGALVTATGGTGPYSYTLQSGTLPSGLNLNSATGAITGTPISVGTFSFVIVATDASAPVAQTVSSDYSIVIAGAPITLSVGNVSVSGDNATNPTLDFVVTLSSLSATNVSFIVDTVAGTAEPSDFLALTGVLVTVPAGNLTATVQVSVTADTTVETPETVSLVLSSPVGATIATGTGVGTIGNDDQTLITISSVSSALESANATVTIFTQSPVEGGIDVAYSVIAGDNADPFQNATAGVDFVGGVSSSGNFASGSVARTVVVNEDSLVEAPEQLRVVLSGVTLPPGILASDVLISGTSNTHRHVILNNDVTNLTSSAASVTEGNSGTPQLSFTLSLSAAAVAPVDVLLSTASFGTNPADSADFTALSGLTVTFPVGVTSRAVTVNVTPDNIVEANETLQLQLANPALPIATITTPAVTGTINNDDSAVLSVNSVSVLEGNVGTTLMNFQLSLSQPVQGAVNVTFTPTAGTATAGVDFDATPSNAPFPSLNVAAGRSVNIFGDTTVEPDETLSVVLSALSLPPGVTAVTLASVPGVGTILNDDAVGPTTIVLTTPLPTLAFTPGVNYPVSVKIASLSRPTGTATVIATRQGSPATTPISCVLTLIDGPDGNDRIGSCNLAPTSPGVWATTIAFTGTGGFANAAFTSNAILTAPLAPLSINQSATTTVVGQSFTVTVIAAAVSGGPTPSGNITITQFPGSIQTTQPMVGGSATLVLTSRSPVVKGLLVRFSDPSLVYSVADAFVDHTTDQAATATSISLSAASGAGGQSVSVTYTLGVLAPGAVPAGQSGPTGQIQVSDGVTSASCTLVYPTGNCALAPTTPGARQITARYIGDASYLASTSAASAYTVNQGSGTVDLVVSIGNGVRVIDGNLSVYTITVRNVGSAVAGSVNLSNPLPAGALSQSYSCIAGAGSSCGASGVGAINQTILVATTGSVSYRVEVSLPSGSEAAVSNTVTATPASGVTDLNPANNSATDNDPRGLFGSGFEDDIE